MKTRLILIALATTSISATAGPIEDQIRFRQSAYSFISWNASRIKAQVVDKPETYDSLQVQAAANAIAAAANSGLGTLYGAGTDEGTGWKKSRLKAEYFQRAAAARKIALDFNRAATELARAAAMGDRQQIKLRYQDLSKTCKSCHDSFRTRE